ncbi:hypothetical protein [Mycolicibacter sinensis]|uniref:hypothetical protein n=1 Tax=Mycolicibacter sinensis (strain JDM601) TaxID=875328 RepID=UPI000AF43F71|nr:hypothetical protein [Mycolicibacter sinensis]
MDLSADHQLGGWSGRARGRRRGNVGEELLNQGALGGATVEPKAGNDALSLHVVSMSGPAGMFVALTKDNIQPA